MEILGFNKEESELFLTALLVQLIPIIIVGIKIYLSNKELGRTQK